MPIQKLIIAPGQTAYIPSNAIILGIEKTGDADVLSDCLDLTDIEEYKCYYIQWELEGPNSGSDAWENGTLNSIAVSSQDYNITANAYLTNDGGQAIFLAVLQNIAALKDINIPAPSILTRRVLFSVCFKTVPSIAATIFLKLTSSDHTYTLLPARLLADTDTPPCACANPIS